MRPTLTVIYAVNLVGTIGDKGKIPWHIPEDLKFFKEMTEGKTVIMGKKTWDSLPSKARPLPNRQNIVLGYPVDYQGAEVALSLRDAVTQSINKEIFVIGGVGPIKEAELYCDRAIVTIVDSKEEGDCKLFDGKGVCPYPKTTQLLNINLVYGHADVFNKITDRNWDRIEKVTILKQGEGYATYEITYNREYREGPTGCPIWGFFEVKVPEPYASDPAFRKITTFMLNVAVADVESFFENQSDIRVGYETVIEATPKEGMLLSNSDISHMDIISISKYFTWKVTFTKEQNDIIYYIETTSTGERYPFTFSEVRMQRKATPGGKHKYHV